MILYLHPPMNETSCDYPLIPAGIPGLLNLIADGGVEGINIPLEMMIQNNFSISSCLERKEVDMVFIDLHWYIHSYGALSCADICKKIVPDCPVILGGITASVFAREILEKYKSVDGIIYGDSEQALQELVAGTSKDDVSNFLYREHGAVKKSSKQYVISQEEYNSLNFSDYSHLHHREFYMKTDLEGIHRESVKSVWLEVERGCVFDCSICGGGTHAHARIFGRNTPLYRSGEKIAEDMRALNEQGVNRIAFTHDYALLPRKVRDTIEDTIVCEKIEIGILNEFWVAPSRETITRMCTVFEPTLSRFHISCETGNERVRSLNFPGKNTNREYIRAIEKIDRHDVFCELFFSANLPFETRKTWDDTIKLLKKINTPESTHDYFCCAVTLDPLSPLWVDPSRYKVTLEMTEFADYVDMCKQGKRSTGFTSGTLSEEDIYANLESFQNYFEE